MEFGIISDIHDNLTNLKKAITALKERNINDLIVCGDFCSPFVVNELGNSEMNVYAIFGNNDGDRFNIQKVAANFPQIKIYGEFIGDLDTQLVLDGIKIGVTHYPFYAHTMIKTGWFDCVFFGHTHKYHKQKFGSSLFMNPGEIAGLFGEASFAIYNTQDQGSEQIFI
jgi:putative phosphoesterase